MGDLDSPKTRQKTIRSRLSFFRSSFSKNNNKFSKQNGHFLLSNNKSKITFPQKDEYLMVCRVTMIEDQPYLFRVLLISFSVSSLRPLCYFLPVQKRVIFSAWWLDHMSKNSSQMGREALLNQSQPSRSLYSFSDNYQIQCPF